MCLHRSRRLYPLHDKAHSETLPRPTPHCVTYIPTTVERRRRVCRTPGVVAGAPVLRLRTPTCTVDGSTFRGPGHSPWGG